MYMTHVIYVTWTLVAQRFALWALDEVVPGQISGSRNLGFRKVVTLLNWFRYMWSAVPRTGFRCSGTHNKTAETCYKLLNTKQQVYR